MNDSTRRVADTAAEPSAELEADLEHAIAVCGGDARASVRALLVGEQLPRAAEVERLTAQWQATVSRGYVRTRTPKKVSN